MAENRVVVAGRLNRDGTLHVDEKLPLSPGPVQVTVEASHQGRGKDVCAVLERIWEERKERGTRRRSKEEIDAEIDAIRNDSELEIGEIERLHDQARGSGG